MNKEYEQFVWDPEVDQNYDPEVYGYNNVVKNGLYNGIYKSKCAFTTKANSQRNRLFDLKIIESEAPLSRAFPCLIESAGFANQLLSDSSYLPMEVGRYVASPFH